MEREKKIEKNTVCVEFLSILSLVKDGTYAQITLSAHVNIGLLIYFLCVI